MVLVIPTGLAEMDALLAALPNAWADDPQEWLVFSYLVKRGHEPLPVPLLIPAGAPEEAQKDCAATCIRACAEQYDPDGVLTVSEGWIIDLPEWADGARAVGDSAEAAAYRKMAGIRRRHALVAMGETRDKSVAAAWLIASERPKQLGRLWKFSVTEEVAGGRFGGIIRKEA
jgi:hypothetical protein